MDGPYDLSKSYLPCAIYSTANSDGSNAVTVMPSRAIEVGDLARSFENGELLLHYQPQVDISQRWPKIVGYEALLRWPLMDGRFVPPDRFIHAAEQSGLVLSLDIWVIEAVCKELARINTSGAPRIIGMAANVSAQQFGRRYFAQSVADIVSRAGIDPSWLTLEITERAILEDSEITLENIYALRELGVSLSLDDFGTGYSSLFYLRSLPIQEVKLDRSFVRELPHRLRDAAIMRATIDLASELGLRVIAEGVEQACQASWLRLNGCRLIQGFLYGQPAARPDSASSS